MTADEELTASALRLLGDDGLEDAELDRRVTRFQGALRRLRDDPAEATRIDALVMDAEQSAPPDDLEAFARDLRALRAKAGLDYPEMAELSHYTMKTLAA